MLNNKVKNNLHVTELRVKTLTLIISALTLVASLSWLNAIQKLTEYLIPTTWGKYKILGYFIAAMIITILGILIIYAIEPYSNHDERNDSKNKVGAKKITIFD